MRHAGPGSRGIVYGQPRAGTVGHVFNVVNDEGAIRFLDGQPGNVARLDPYQRFFVLRTN